jgi:hypothetical protein
MAIERLMESLWSKIGPDRIQMSNDPITGPVAGTPNETSDTGKTADEIRVENYANDTGNPPGIASPSPTHPPIG